MTPELGAWYHVCAVPVEQFSIRPWFAPTSTPITCFEVDPEKSTPYTARLRTVPPFPTTPNRPPKVLLLRGPFATSMFMEKPPMPNPAPSKVPVNGCSSLPMGVVHAGAGRRVFSMLPVRRNVACSYIVGCCS